MIFRFLILMIFPISLFSNEDSSALTKQRLEILQLKEDLTQFYKKREEEDLARKKEIEDILKKIEDEKSSINLIKEQNEELLKEIRGQIVSKTTKIYEQMKPKVAALVFDQMILEGKIEEVFDIIIRLKESNVSVIMRSLSVESASILTFMLENFKTNEIKGE
ncbi:hypothetical protein Q6A83_01515 [Aliarcobacter skirrowii]|uniref:hypothetical protein n=1 Tax=Aliarcobacter skirrowii TaxID=28200 RepID=UPI0029AF69D8|nr:hypothetical protein [Aliarcobacter skirrowii]MDX4049449.1 hypothetical protein [Aliarcobacter skirrowii]